MIIANNLKKIYGKDFVSVNNLSFHIKKGEIVGFVGQNGAGKTTTIKMLTGILNRQRAAFRSMVMISGKSRLRQNSRLDILQIILISFYG